MLGDLNTNMRFTAKSVDDDNPELSMVARCGYGGIAILWKKEMDDKNQILNEGNNRVQVIQIDTECRPVCLINIYILGIVRNGKNTVDIKSGRGTIYGLLGAELQVRKGFSPITAHNLWKVYALPRMTYGIEIMPMINKDKEQLEILQKKILKQNQGLPCRAANTGVYVLLGAVPVEMVIERNMLSTFMNIARNKLSVEYHILYSRELAMKNENGKIFINKIQEILEKYGLGKVEEIHSPKAKEAWKIIVKKHQNKFWKETCKEDQKKKKTLEYLQLQEYITKPHNIWHSVKNSEIDVKAGEIKAKIATSLLKLLQLPVYYVELKMKTYVTSYLSVQN